MISSSDWRGSWRSFARWNARGLRFAIVRLTTKLRWPRRKSAKGEENPVRGDYGFSRAAVEDICLSSQQEGREPAASAIFRVQK